MGHFLCTHLATHSIDFVPHCAGAEGSPRPAQGLAEAPAAVDTMQLGSPGHLALLHAPELRIGHPSAAALPPSAAAVSHSRPLHYALPHRSQLAAPKQYSKSSSQPIHFLPSTKRRWHHRRQLLRNSLQVWLCSITSVVPDQGT